MGPFDGQLEQKILLFTGPADAATQLGSCFVESLQLL